MKKLINDVETVLAESLDGFAAAHADIVTLGDERQFVRRRQVKPGKVALISGGGSGHEPLHAGFVGHGMLDAACPGQVFTSPTPDQMLAAARVGRRRGGRAVHRQELLRRHDELPDGRRDARPRERDRDRQRRRRGRELDLHHRAARRRRHADRREDRRRCGRAWRRPGGAEGAGRRRQHGHRVDGRGADLVHRACRRQADLPDRHRRDGDGRGHPRRAGTAPRAADLRRRDRRRAERRDPEGPVAQAAASR